VNIDVNIVIIILWGNLLESAFLRSGFEGKVLKIVNINRIFTHT